MEEAIVSELGTIVFVVAVFLLAIAAIASLFCLSRRIFEIVTHRATTRIPSWLGIWLGAGIVALATGYFTAIRPTLLRGRQVRTCADVRSIATMAQSFRDDQGRYPLDLGELLIHWRRDSTYDEDVWGNEFFYRADGETILVASFGKDGRPDYNYAALPMSRFHRSREEWGDVRSVWSGDQVMTDAGWFQEACK